MASLAPSLCDEIGMGGGLTSGKNQGMQTALQPVIVSSVAVGIGPLAVAGTVDGDAAVVVPAKTFVAAAAAAAAAAAPAVAAAVAGTEFV